MRKSEYAPLGKQEAFIVPLLANEISSALADVHLMTGVNNSQVQRIALDCGCGNQPFRKAIVNHGYQYESLDVTQNSFGSVDYICALDCHGDEFRAVIQKRYAFVLATEVLEHVSDWNAAFVNIAACLQPGGYVLLTAPFFYPLHEEPHDYCRPTVHQFEKYSRNAGLDIVSIKKLGSSVDVIGTVLGATTIRYSSPKNLLSKVITRLLVAFQAWAFAMLLEHRDQLVSDCTSIYLSNIIVLRKAPSC